jgi:Holliday junction DNA helicase RuvB
MENRIDSLSSDNKLRPLSWDEYVGNKDMVDQLKISIEAAKKNGRPVHHTLMYGTSGGGKTTAANIVAREMGGESRVVSCTSIKTTSDITNIVLKLKPMSVLFLDEIHALRRDVEEHLYHAMEDGKIDLKLKGDNGDTEIVTVKVNPFTLVGATTKPGKMSEPMRNRFPLSFCINPYSVDEICQIIKAASVKIGSRIFEQITLKNLAQRSRGVPRVANNLLLISKDLADVKNNGIITESIVNESMATMGIASNGLTTMDKRYMKVIKYNYKNRPVGVKAVASTLVDIDTRAIEDVIEPFLLRENYVLRSLRGRYLSEKGMKEV